MGLEEYRRRRDFHRTPEPAGQARPSTAAAGVFVVQKHAARRLHYDFRLEMEGVLRSWAVTKGPSYDPAEKRLAVHTEDHPLEYGEFEGTIPEGEYGGGTVLLWDRGHWYPEGDPVAGYRKGKLGFRLDGEKLKGRWALVRLRPRGGKGSERNWLLVKERDEFAEMEDVLAERPRSVVSGKDIGEIAAGDGPVWRSNRGRMDAGALPGAVKGRLPGRIEPQLATLVAEAPEGGEWLHEIKFDGYRALCAIEGGKARVLTRHGNDWTDKFGAVARAVAELPVHSALLDGEVVVLDAHGASSFQLLQEAISEGRDQAMAYFAFDLLFLDGVDLREVPLEKRKEALAELIPTDDGPLRYSDHFDGRGPEVRQRACSFALEGVVSKRRDRPYRQGRNRDWLKAKCLSRQELVIAGFTPPQGQRTGIGALLLGYWRGGDFCYAGKVGTGFSQRTLADLAARLEPLRRDAAPFKHPPREPQVRWVAPELVAEVEFTNWTRDGHLRHPSFQGLRFDKEPREVFREVTVPAEGRRPDLQERLQSVRLTNPDRVLYPEQGITKRGLAAYYLEAADWMLPHVLRRPLTLVRCPQGRGKECFYQRHPHAGSPKQIHRVPVPGADAEPYLYIEDLDGLLALVQIGVLEIHTWGCRVENPECADLMVFDLDPDPDLSWPAVVEGALAVRALLSELGLESFVKTTGGKGLHVVAPLAPEHPWDEIKGFAKALAESLAAGAPERYVANMAKARRQGRIFVDYLRNQRTATFIAPYSTRAREGAPVAVPLTWAELESGGLRSDHFTVETILRRLASLPQDPWAGIDDLRQRITPKARRRLKLKEG